MPITIRSANDSYVNVKNGKFSIFSYGFRPFFLAAGAYAILALIPWVAYVNDWLDIGHVAMKTWHSHEMIFGFVSAAISGFLLTAIPNWTATPALTGKKLQMLFLCWLAGRVAFWLFLIFDKPILGYLLFLDILLPVCHGIHIARIFIATNNRRNFIFIAIMASMAAANLLIILELSGITDNSASIGSIFAINVIMLTVAIIGGRVTPNFTRGYLKQRGINADSIKTYPILEKAVILSFVLIAILDLIVPHSYISYIVACLAAIINLARFSRWGMGKILKEPLLWSLHLGYIWLIITLFLKGAEQLLSLPYNMYIHAFTVGAIATYILAIMSRASLGHTGRPLIVKPIISYAFIIISLTAIVRLLTALCSEYLALGVLVAGTLWVCAFALFVYVYAPILTSPRADGREG